MRHKRGLPSALRSGLLLLTCFLAALVAATLVFLTFHTHHLLHATLISRTAAPISFQGIQPPHLAQQQQNEQQPQDNNEQQPVPALQPPDNSRQKQLPWWQAQQSIPRVLHVNYMSGPGQLLVDALRPLSHFRKEWWISCRTHHPGWRFMFWDAAACEGLLQQRYPWFLATWRLFENSTVLQSDAIRPFILHAHGGAYLDLDSECFSSMEPWLAGAHLVLQAEQGDTVNNAQMASVPGLPLWEHFQRAIAAKAAAGQRHPLHTTGPHVLTAVVRAATGRKNGDLPGVYTVQAAPASNSSNASHAATLVVYGPRQFFTPCGWNDWDCAVQLARQKPMLGAAGKRAAATAAKRAQQQQQQQQQQQSQQGQRQGGHAQGQSAPLMVGVEAVAGVHHFSGSWLGLDGSKSLSLRKEAMSAVMTFLSNASSLVQAPCQQLRVLQPQQQQPMAAIARSSWHLNKQQHQQQHQSCDDSATSIPVCWESVTADLAAGRCVVLSVRLLPDGWSYSHTAAQQQHQQHQQPHRRWWHRSQHQQQQQQQLRAWQQQEASGQVAEEALQHWFGAEYELAEAGCQVHVATNVPLQLGSETQEPQQQPEQSGLTGSIRGHPRFTGYQAVLGLAPDPFATPQAHTLDGLLQLVNTTRLTLLYLGDICGSCPTAVGAPVVLDVMNHLYLTSSRSLDDVGQLVVQMPSNGAQQHKVYAMHQHLYQEQGYLGYSLQSLCGGRGHQLGFIRQANSTVFML